MSDWELPVLVHSHHLLQATFDKFLLIGGFTGDNGTDAMLKVYAKSKDDAGIQAKVKRHAPNYKPFLGWTEEKDLSSKCSTWIPAMDAMGDRVYMACDGDNDILRYSIKSKSVSTVSLSGGATSLDKPAIVTMYNVRAFKANRYV